MRKSVKIPDYITVHDGPPDSPALNYTIPFADYIKNVVSRAVSPLWPESAIRAVIYAAQTYALGKILDGYYRRRGYDFDITGDAEHDQRYEPSSCVFSNVNRFADEMANMYIADIGSTTPIELEVSAYEDGSWVYISGDSEDGCELTPELTLRLASEGKNAAEILAEAFGSVDLVQGTTSDLYDPESGCEPLSLGDRGCAVSDLQRKLNLISTSFASIPKINPADGFYGPSTEIAVREFQRIFDLPDDGLAGCATRRRIGIVYRTIRALMKCLEIQTVPAIATEDLEEGENATLTEGDTGERVRYIQRLLNFASLLTRTVKPVEANGIYDRSTTESVIDFQRTLDLPITGDVDLETFNMLLSLQSTSYARLEDSAYIPEAAPFGGRELKLGSRGDDVYLLQIYLNCAADLYSDAVGRVRVTGVYTIETRDAVRAVQRIHGIPQTGVVREGDWDIIAALYNDCAAARYLAPEQFPGYLLEHMRNREVTY